MTVLSGWAKWNHVNCLYQPKLVTPWLCNGSLIYALSSVLPLNIATFMIIARRNRLSLIYNNHYLVSEMIHSVEVATK
jgi:hypothetical protein